MDQPDQPVDPVRSTARARDLREDRHRDGSTTCTFADTEVLSDAKHQGSQLQASALVDYAIERPVATRR